MADVHVVPDGNGWKVEHGGDVDGTYDTQQEAIDAGRQAAKAEECELVVHGQDGGIREKVSEGNDPPEVPG